MLDKFAFVVGAPRCGTTSLSAYLQQHPGIRFSLVKEPHFFSRIDFAGMSPEEQKRVIETDYLATYFPDFEPGSDAVYGEGSVTYLYEPEQMAAVAQFLPNAKFIIALRDPIDMLQSLHARLLFTGDETEPEFERAWGLIGERRQGRHVPDTCVDPRLLDYERFGRLGQHVERLIAAVGRERCFFSVFDDFVSDPHTTYRRLLAFLELPDQPLLDQSAHRATVGFKSAWLQRLLNRPPGVKTWEAAEKIWLKVRRAQGSSGKTLAKGAWRLRKRLLRWNEAPPPKKGLSPQFQRVLQATFAEDVDHLGRILGRDLGTWLGRRPKASG